MKKKSQKKTIDTTSIHEGLIDNYKVDDKNINKDNTGNIQDFQSVTESIEKLENINVYFSFGKTHINFKENTLI